MKFSEAIRAGAKLRPQAFGSMFEDGGSCALGAACEATGFGPEDYGKKGQGDHLGRTFPDLCYGAQTCPEGGLLDRNGRHCGDRADLFEPIIVHLNDDHHWTRERIAAWVETVGY